MALRSGVFLMNLRTREIQTSVRLRKQATEEEEVCWGVRGGGVGGQIRIQVDLGLLLRTLWPYDFWTLTEKELDFIIKWRWWLSSIFNI